MCVWYHTPDQTSSSRAALARMLSGYVLCQALTSLYMAQKRTWVTSAISTQCTLQLFQVDCTGRRLALHWFYYKNSLLLLFARNLIVALQDTLYKWPNSMWQLAQSSNRIDLRCWQAITYCGKIASPNYAKNKMDIANRTSEFFTKFNIKALQASTL
jgi:hypothetical protein